MFPSAILVEKASERRWFSLEADRRFAQRGESDGYVFMPSLKRQLRNYAEGRTAVAFATGPGDESHVMESLQPPMDLAELLTGFLEALAESIRRSRNLPGIEPLEAVIT